MSCNVMPLKKYEGISYHVKCVDVVSERVFGDVYVSQQSENSVYREYESHFPHAYKKRKNNIIEKTLNAPDFMELNRKKPVRRASVAPAKTTRRTIKRSMSAGDHEALTFSYQQKSAKKNDVVPKTPKEYPTPLPRPPPREEAVTSLVDQLLLNIYGLPVSDKGRSESESTASSLKPRPQHRYLQKARLLLKSKVELEVLIMNLREHIGHTGGLLIRQLRRKDYLSIKRDKQCDIITAHLQAHSAKRSE